MNQCVPSWDFNQNSNPVKIKFQAHSNSSNFLPEDPSLEYEVAELTWENGQLAMHGLGIPRVANKPAASWDKPHGGGTLESIVNQATCLPHHGGVDNINDLVPWYDHHRAVANPGASSSVTMTMDALVPCNNNTNTRRNDNQEPSTHVREPVISRAAACSTRVGSCSGAARTGLAEPRAARVGINSCRTNGSMSESATCGGSESRQVTLDTWEREVGGASMASPENTISDQECTKTSADDHETISRSRSQKKNSDDEGKKKLGIGKSSVSTKRSRAAAIHNQSERKRRDKINQKMKTLQKLVPNSSKTDKASMLDEVIEYLKQLQAQVHMMNRMSTTSMMLPLAMQQQLQMSMMGMGMGMGMGSMGMGMGMDMNTINRAAAAASGVPPVMPQPAPFMPVPPATWDNPGECLPPPPPPPASSVMPDPLAALLACQSPPTTMDAYSRLAAMFQQLQQQHPPASKS